jgi:hypothetical protein
MSDETFHLCLAWVVGFVTCYILLTAGAML